MCLSIPYYSISDKDKSKCNICLVKFFWISDVWPQHLFPLILIFSLLHDIYLVFPREFFIN